MSDLLPLWIAAMALLLLALAGLLWPLLREADAAPAATEARESLRAVYQAQRGELARARAAGELGLEEHAQALEELERRLLLELQRLDGSNGATASPAWRRHVPAAGLSLLLPLAAVALYLKVGDPQAAAALLSPGADTHAQRGADTEALVAQLEARLAREPEQLEGWLVLARSREVMEDYAAATTAYRRALALAVAQGAPAGLQARLQADLADALASARGGALDAEVADVLAAALALDADQPKALALAGTAALRRGDADAARGHWQRLLGLLEPESELALRVRSDLQRLEAPQEGAVPAAAGLSGTVRLAPALRDRVQPGDTLLLIVRAPAAGRMPVALLRLPAAQLPLDFALDDRHAMSPERPMSRYEDLRIEARISRDGSPQRRAGEPISAPLPVHAGARGIALLVDRLEPAAP